MEYSCWSSGRSHVQNLGSSRCNSPFVGDYAQIQLIHRAPPQQISILIMLYCLRILYRLVILLLELGTPSLFYSLKNT